MSRLVHDIFISHSGRDKHWVAPFRIELETVLRQKFSKVDIWIDTEDIRGGARLSPQIEEAIRSSAVLVSVISTAYLRSEWCKLERELFFETCGGADKCDQRQFVLLIDDGEELGDLPAEFNDIIYYEFFVKKGEVTIPYALPIKDPTGHERLFFLRHHLVKGLRAIPARCAVLDWNSLQENVSGTPPEASAAESQENAPAASASMSSSTGGPGGRLFLTEVPRVASEVRGRIELALEGHGIVVPQGAYASAAEPPAQEVAAILHASDVFVQILTPFSFEPSAAYPDGYARWIQDQAEAVRTAPAGGRPPLQIIRWESPEFDFSMVSDDKRGSLLSSDSRPEPEFVNFVVDEVAKQRQRNKVPDRDYNSDCLFVCPDGSEQDLGRSVGERIVDLVYKSIGVFVEPRILKRSHDVKEHASAFGPRGLILVLNEFAKDWIEKKLHEFRDARCSREIDPPECAVFVMKPELEGVVPPWPGWIREVCYWDDSQVDGFISELGGKIRG